jgi:hypothetical protein
VSILLALAALWPGPQDGVVISLPRSWMLGQERSACPLRQSDVIALLGEPDGHYWSAWSEQWYYRRLGVWVHWECPCVSWGLANRLCPEVEAVLRALWPARARPLLWLVEATFVPRESLVEIGCYAWGVKFYWRCE